MSPVKSLVLQRVPARVTFNISGHAQSPTHCLVGRPLSCPVSNSLSCGGSPGHARCPAHCLVGRPLGMPGVQLIVLVGVPREDDGMRTQVHFCDTGIHYVSHDVARNGPGRVNQYAPQKRYDTH